MADHAGTQPTSMIVDASPTRDFFISILVRDIGLADAIADLVDNCIDGARRLRPKGDLSGLRVAIELSQDKFSISDNCGGIPFITARDYAFRFGRPSDMPDTPNSIGQFGVGMKRALFKLGKKFKIVSRAPTTAFELEVDVDEWKKQTGDWHFEFSSAALELPEVAPEDCGTSIVVSPIHASVAEQFALESFRNRLGAQLATAHQQSLERGLDIEVNGDSLRPRTITVLNSRDLKVGRRTFRFDTRPPVMADIFAGVAESNPSAAGWYVFCNGRLVLEADKSDTTGWGENRGTRVPNFHNQFSRFRGVVFFDCSDASLLPWNTAKTGVDTASPTYRSARQEMIELMRPVINFLNELDAESEVDLHERSLTVVLQQAKSVNVVQSITAKSFTVTTAKAKKQIPQEGYIQYKRPLDQIEAVRAVLKVGSRREVGERTFDHFFETWCKD